jgi:ribosomal protein S18 acetylase RimI-like enzyme
MVLDVVPYRDRAIALYRSFGFVDVDTIHEYPFEMRALARDL